MSDQPTPLPPERIEEIERRVNAATPGPWKMWNGWGPLVDVEPELMACERLGPDYEGGFAPGRGAVDIYATRADFEFVAMARTDVPAMLTAIDELEAENGALKMIISSAEPLCARATACGAILREVYEIGKGTSA